MSDDDGMFDDADDDLEQLPDSLKALAVEAEAAAVTQRQAAAAAAAAGTGGTEPEAAEDAEDGFEPAPAFAGSRDGMVYKTGGKGTGYYPDTVGPRAIPRTSR